MTASNPCCECKEPLQYQESKPRWCERCEKPIKETPAAVEKAKPYFSFSPKLKPLTDAEKKEMIAGISFEPEKDIEENLRLMNHGIIYQQPEKEWWEESFDAIFSNRMSVDSASGEQVFFKQKVELIKSFISRIAVQSEKKGREAERKEFALALSGGVGDFSEGLRREGRNAAVDYILMNVDIGGLKLNAHEVLEAARSSDEGKTTQAGR